MVGYFTVADWDNPVTLIIATPGHMFQTSRRMLQTFGPMLQMFGPVLQTFGPMWLYGRESYNKHPAECLIPIWWWKYSN